MGGLPRAENEAAVDQRYGSTEAEAHIKCLYHEGRINTMKVYLKNQLESLKRLSAAL